MAEMEDIAKIKATLEQLTRHVTELETRIQGVRTELRAAVSNLEAKLEKFMEDMRSEY